MILTCAFTTASGFIVPPNECRTSNAMNVLLVDKPSNCEQWSVMCNHLPCAYRLLWQIQSRADPVYML